jgi:hypothetical protein
VSALRALAAAALLAPASAQAADLEVGDFKLTFGGLVQYDLRFQTERIRVGEWYRRLPEPPTLSRNELIGKTRIDARYKKFGMKWDVDLVLRAYPRPERLDDLYLYNVVTPFRIEAHSLYLYARDLFGAQGFDISIGQQKAMFGVGDQFNPTNTVTPFDFEDVLLFGDQTANLMVRLDYTPTWNVQLTGILVPIFKPALLPRTSYLAQTPDRQPFADPELRHNLIAEEWAGVIAGQLLPGLAGVFPTRVTDVSLQLPEFSPKNMQGFFRVGATLGGQDIALSYYRGFSDLPQPVGNRTSQVFYDEPRCAVNYRGETSCVDGELQSTATLAYPRQHVIGFNMAGQMNPFGKIHKSFKSIGYRIEVGVFVPEAETRLDVELDDIQFGFVNRDGIYDYPNDDNTVVSKEVFAKWVLGLDYQFNRHLYMNTQWVHGFPDEWGAGDWTNPGGTVTRASGLRPGIDNFLAECVDLTTFAGKGETCAREWLKPRLGDYLVWGTDITFLSQAATLRLFAIWDMVGVWEDTWDPAAGERVRIHHGPFSANGFSMVLYPGFTYKFGNGLELQAGALLQLGKPWTKFGAPENGRHQVWTRARFSF